MPTGSEGESKEVREGGESLAKVDKQFSLPAKRGEGEGEGEGERD